MPADEKPRCETCESWTPQGADKGRWGRCDGLVSFVFAHGAGVDDEFVEYYETNSQFSCGEHSPAEEE